MKVMFYSGLQGLTYCNNGISFDRHAVSSDNTIYYEYGISGVIYGAAGINRKNNLVIDD